MMVMTNRLMRILVIEDNPGDARLLQEYLAEGGADRFTTIHADRLATGLPHLSQPGIDVVLLDLTLPDSDGVETLIRVQAHAPSVPIVVLTGRDDDVVAVQLLQAGAQDYLVKGQVTSPLLVRALRYATERKHAQDKFMLYREIFANSIEAIAIIDLHGHYLEQNAAHSQFLGFSDEDLRGKTPAVHLGEEGFRGIIRELTTSGRYHGEVTSHTKHGTAMDIEVSAFAVQNEAGQPVCYVSVKRDITERKRMEQALRATRDDLERRVEDRTRDLQEKLDELERFEEVVVGRELKMIGLEKELAQLRKEVKTQVEAS
jgi:two-component system, cell cycle sensor histidine kinase and response regulator CckA